MDHENGRSYSTVYAAVLKPRVSISKVMDKNLHKNRIIRGHAMKSDGRMG